MNQSKPEIEIITININSDDDDDDQVSETKRWVAGCRCHSAPLGLFVAGRRWRWDGRVSQTRKRLTSRRTRTRTTTISLRCVLTAAETTVFPITNDMKPPSPLPPLPSDLSDGRCTKIETKKKVQGVYADLPQRCSRRCIVSSPCCQSLENKKNIYISLPPENRGNKVRQIASSSSSISSSSLPESLSLSFSVLIHTQTRSSTC